MKKTLDMPDQEHDTHATGRWIGVLLILISAASFSALPIFTRLAYQARADAPTILLLRYFLAAVHDRDQVREPIPDVFHCLDNGFSEPGRARRNGAQGRINRKWMSHRHPPCSGGSDHLFRLHPCWKPHHAEDQCDRRINKLGEKPRSMVWLTNVNR